MRRFVIAFASASLTVGCSTQTPTTQRTESRAEPIINGSPDTTHAAVVAIIGNSGSCSGTVLAVQGGFGYAITAGHCVGQTKNVVVGNDYNNPSAVYTIVAHKVHPLYKAGDASSPYDFTMVKFSGAPANMPTIPPLDAANDALKQGDLTDLVGYGLTSSPNGFNSQRRHIQVPLAAVGSLKLGWSGTPGGTCNGDSGGPALVTINGQEYVAGVTSYGGQDCLGFSVDGRVSPFVQCFIQPFIDGVAIDPNCGKIDIVPETTTCSTCVTSAEAAQCATQTTTCQGSQECLDYASCVQMCDNALTCYTDCKTLYPNGATLLGQLDDCICFGACTVECAPECNGPKGTCGFTPTDATCKTCLEGSCCAQASACYADATCQMCADAAFPMGCDTYGLWNDYNNCLANNCSTECGVTTGAGGSGAGGSGAAGSGTAGSGTAGSGTAGSGTAGTGTAGTGAAGTGTAGTGTAGTGAAGAGTAGTAGSGTAGQSAGGTSAAGKGGSASGGKAGAGTAGTASAGKGGSGTAGSTASAGTTGSGTGGKATAGTTGAAGSTGTTGGTGGVGGTPDNAATDSGSSGGCAVADTGSTPGGAAWLVVLGLALAAKRRRRLTPLPRKRFGPARKAGRDGRLPSSPAFSRSSRREKGPVEAASAPRSPGGSSASSLAFLAPWRLISFRRSWAPDLR